MRLETPLHPASLSAALDVPTDRLFPVPGHHDGGDPWYIQMVVGFGAWIASLFLFASIGFFGGLNDAARQIVMCATGLGFFFGGAALNARSAGVFSRQFSLALMFGGQALICVGLIDIDDMDWGVNMALLALGSSACTGAIILGTRDAAAQFVSAAATAVLIQVALFEPLEFAGLQLFALAACIGGTALLLWPTPLRNTRPLGTVLLIAASIGFAAQEVAGPLIGAISDAPALNLPLAWVLRACFLACLAWPLWDEIRRAPPATAPLAGAIALAGLLVLAVSPASLAALLLVGIGWRMGARLLCGLGIALQIGLIVWLYYDLGWSLTGKGFSLIAAGAVLLAGWWLWRRHAGEAAHED